MNIFKKNEIEDGKFSDRYQVTDPTALAPQENEGLCDLRQLVVNRAYKKQGKVGIGDENSSAEESRYEIIEKIGEGGTANVYRATDRNMQREVALKRFFSNKGPDCDKADYLGELQAFSKIQHPNVVVTHDSGTDADGHFIVMNLLSGCNMQEFLDSESIDLKEFELFALQILDGLSTVHDSRILHLDLKPSNIMMSQGASGRFHYTIVDFGSAKAIPEGQNKFLNPGTELQGSIHFMSPEQLNSGALDERSDIYSLGCVFYQCLAGNRPFEGDTHVQVMAAHMMNKFDKLEPSAKVPEKLAELVNSMLSLNFSDRPSSSVEVLTELEQIF